MTRAGRPTKRTPETVNLLLGALQKGNTRTTACGLAAIGHSTFAEWLNKFPEFREAVEHAEGLAKATAMRAITAAITGGDWRAALAWYERRFPAEMGQHAQLDVTIRQRAEQIAKELGGVSAAEIIAEAERIARGG
jgi:hypothetical protein